MSRRRFRYNPTTKEMEEISYVDSGYSDSPMVHGDIPGFWSPVDGTFVEGRKAYEEHNKRNGVVPFEAGDEKKNQSPKPGSTARERQALRENIWENVDRAIQRDPKYHTRRHRIE